MSRIQGCKSWFDFKELGKLAIDYSDGVIEADGNVDSELIKYTENSNIPLLKYPGEDFAEQYESFYNSICGE